jgi:hypothetical protein
VSRNMTDGRRDFNFSIGFAGAKAG